MVGKNKLAKSLGHEAKVKHRFKLKKLSLGLASVAIGSSLILSHVEAVSASGEDQTAVSLQESKDKEVQETVGQGQEEKLYSFEFQNKTTKGSTTVKAKSAEEAEKFFRKYANDSGLGNLYWSYNDKTLTFTANDQKPVEDNETGYSTKEAAETAAKKALEKDSVNKSYTVKQGANGRWFYLLSPNPVEEPGKPGEEKPGEKPGEQKPGEEKPGEEKPGEQKPGEQKPGEQKPGDKKPEVKKTENKKPTEQKQAAKKPGKTVQAVSRKPGQRLPNTATGTWALGLFGLTSLAGGLFAHKHKKD